MGAQRTWMGVAAVAAVLAGVGGSATASASAVPAPEVAVTPPMADVIEVFGANLAGDAFVNTYRPGSGDLPAAAIRHADGSVTPAGAPFAGDGAIASDGRLWLTTGGSLWSVAPDGTRLEHPVTGSAATATTGIIEVVPGPDGRIWFLDRNRSQVGAIAADGTGIEVDDVAGTGKLSQLAVGGDGRRWVAREGGGIQAIALDGTVTTYPTLGVNVSGLVAAGTSLYATTSKGLYRIAADGSRTLARPGVLSSFEDVGASDGWAWFRQGDRVLAASASGRIAAPGIQASFAYPSSFEAVDLAPDAAGGFVGTSNQSLVRIPSGALAETYSAAAQIVAERGTNWIRVTATGRTPAGAPLSGTVEVVLWGSAYLPDPLLPTVGRATVVGRVQLVAGRGSLDVPITADLVRAARPGGLLHTSCCGVSVRRPGTASQTGMSSWVAGIGGGPTASYYGPVVPSSTMLWLDAMSRGALGRSMDGPGQVYWAGKMASGAASRTSVAQSVVGSSTYRRHRVDDAYQRWFGRLPSESERTYWADRLAGGTTTSALDLALAGKPAARDLLGTSNAKRGLHLARALHLADSSGSGFASKLDGGTPWTTVVRDAYWSASAKEKRLNEMGARSSYTPSLGALASQWQRTGDERSALVAVLATLPGQTELYV